MIGGCWGYIPTDVGNIPWLTVNQCQYIFFGSTKHPNGKFAHGPTLLFATSQKWAFDPLEVASHLVSGLQPVNLLIHIQVGKRVKTKTHPCKLVFCSNSSQNSYTPKRSTFHDKYIYNGLKSWESGIRTLCGMPWLLWSMCAENFESCWIVTVISTQSLWYVIMQGYVIPPASTHHGSLWISGGLLE